MAPRLAALTGRIDSSQNLRFQQLLKLFPENGTFSVCDIGCGYGAFAKSLKGQFPDAVYSGIDISESMIEAANLSFGERQDVSFHVGHEPPSNVDFCVASGIFNVRLGHTDEAWMKWFGETLDLMNEFSEAGFAFNALTSYSDADKMRPDLYYANCLDVFDICKTKYSRNVALLHDYGLYEFTILVRKNT